MSLVSLTFGDGRNRMSVPSQLTITRPQDHIKVPQGAEPKLEIQKVSTFLGFNGVYIIGKVTSGAISQEMCGIATNGKKFKITEIESKYPNCNLFKQGMTIGMSVEGIDKEDVDKGEMVRFDNA